MSRDTVRTAAITIIGGGAVELVLRSNRFTTSGDSNYQSEWDAGRPVIFILWHGRLLPLSWFHRSWNLVTLISPSADGETIARVVGRWGYTVVRGSSSRGGGPAFRDLVRYVRGGRSVAVTPDGPRGPREKIKSGVMHLAQLTGCALLPVTASASRAWWFEGWDRFLVPRPFATVRIAYGAPVFVPRDADADQVRSITESVERSLTDLTADLDVRS